MKAMILAAGLGTRLKPWTLHHPKALVPVNGKPMLERVVESLCAQGFDDITVNVHHFSDQIISFLNSRGWTDIKVSDESAQLLDTGGGILSAEQYLVDNDEPFLIHNVDILSDADLRGFMARHRDSGNDCSLLVSGRESSRKLIFGSSMELRGWHSLKENAFRPESYVEEAEDKEFAFSGIHIMSTKVFEDFRRLGLRGKFPIMDYYLSVDRECTVGGVLSENLHLIDIGKPETLSQAQRVIYNDGNFRGINGDGGPYHDF